MAAKVPATVAMRAARTETERVVLRALKISLSWNSSRYQSREKPVQTARLLLLLKEKTISTKMGAYRKRKTSAMNRRLPIRRSFLIA